MLDVATTRHFQVPLLVPPTHLLSPPLLFPRVIGHERGASGEADSKRIRFSITRQLTVYGFKEKYKWGRGEEERKIDTKFLLFVLQI